MGIPESRYFPSGMMSWDRSRHSLRFGRLALSPSSTNYAVARQDITKIDTVNVYPMKFWNIIHIDWWVGVNFHQTVLHFCQNLTFKKPPRPLGSWIHKLNPTELGCPKHATLDLPFSTAPPLAELWNRLGCQNTKLEGFGRNPSFSAFFSCFKLWKTWFLKPRLVDLTTLNNTPLLLRCSRMVWGFWGLNHQKNWQKNMCQLGTGAPCDSFSHTTVSIPELPYANIFWHQIQIKEY